MMDSYREHFEACVRIKAPELVEGLKDYDEDRGYRWVRVQRLWRFYSWGATKAALLIQYEPPAPGDSFLRLKVQPAPAPETVAAPNDAETALTFIEQVIVQDVERGTSDLAKAIRRALNVAS